MMRLVSNAPRLELPNASQNPMTSEDAEITFWRSIVGDLKAGPAEFQAYLDAYPSGVFVPLAKLRLARLNRSPYDHGQAQRILGIVAELGGIAVEDMKPDRRARRLARLRQIAMVLMRDLTPLTLPQIGKAMWGRDHTTVLHAIKIVERMQRGEHRDQEDARATLSLLEQARLALIRSATTTSGTTASAASPP